MYSPLENSQHENSPWEISPHDIFRLFWPDRLTDPASLHLPPFDFVEPAQIGFLDVSDDY